MSFSVKRALHWAGTALAVAGVVFVIFRLNDYSEQLDFSHFNFFFWLIIAGLAIIYGSANIMLALAWWNILLHYGSKVQRRWAIRIYGLSQLAKYVPGNIIHLASRQAMGLAHGVSGWVLVKASVWELGLVSIAGALFFLLVLPQFLSVFTTMSASVCFIGVLLAFVFGLSKFISHAIAKTFVWYALFFMLSCMIFIGLLMLLTDGSMSSIGQVLVISGAFVVAWTVGLVTPGSPAGVGVRELVLLVLLKGLVNEVDLLLAVLLSRVITVCGDILFFLIATVLSQGKLKVCSECINDDKTIK